MRLNLWVLLGLALCAVSIYDVHADVAPSEYECRPYIEKAISELKVADVPVLDSTESDEAILETTEQATVEITDQPIESPASNESNENSVEETPQTTESDQNNDESSNENTSNEESDVAQPETKSDEESIEQELPAGELDADSTESTENAADEQTTLEDQDSNENSKETSSEQPESTVESNDDDNDSKETDSKEDSQENKSTEETSTQTENNSNESVEGADNDNSTTEKVEETDNDSTESQEAESTSTEEQTPSVVEPESSQNDSGENQETEQPAESEQSTVESETDNDSTESQETAQATDIDSKEEEVSVEEPASSTDTDTDGDSTESQEDKKEDVDSTESQETDQTPDVDSKEDATVEDKKEDADGDSTESPEVTTDSKENDNSVEETQSTENELEEKSRAKRSLPDEQENDRNEQSNETQEAQKEESDENVTEEESTESMPEEDLTMEFEIPTNLRDRSHINTLLRLDEEGSIKDAALQKTGDFILKDLKRIYDNAVKPLETMYKYRELSNRHFGDPEIFSKPLVLFMGPWSGGKSTILNYLTENEYTPNSVRSGAEPSPAYFNIMMHGDEPEVLDGTQLAADWTFSGLQKFGQGLNDRLRGHKLPNKLLSRVNIVEIPGILEVRKQVSKVFPFNDACQWFIDRADIIILVYDPSKLDAGPETEAILDQLKGREYQTRILLNKADQVKPEELLRVQGALIWNISPLMSSAQPPVMYTVSLWSHPFENGAPVRLLQAQEKAFLGDLHDAIDKRIENKIASARRFAVRIRNHAKMVDCYLTTYYNQKSLFSNKKHTADQIIENPHTYNIYEGLSTLTNISRYDLPDPEVYLDFFRLNPLWEFKKLAETCTYFKGCPIKKLDMAIAYDLPELVGKYKKLLESNLKQLKAEHKGVCLENCSENKTEPSVKLSKHR